MSPVFRERSRSVAAFLWKVDGLLSEAPRGLVLLLGTAAVALIGVADQYTGTRLSLSLLYLFPIAAGAWWGNAATGAMLSGLAAVVWVFANHGGGQYPAWIELWNAGIHYGIFLLTAGLMAGLRTALLRHLSLAREDPLTGAANHRAFFERLEREIAESRGTGRPFTLVYLDVDDFKALNDTLGHVTGDQVLRQIVQVIRRNVRSTDVVGRLGGDEFAVLLRDTDEEAAGQVVGKLRTLIAADLEISGLSTGVSFGAVTSIGAEERVADIVAEVDKRMYAEKRAARSTFHERLAYEIRRAHDTANVFSLAYLDADDFQAVNDRLGFLIGDQVLDRILEVIADNVRSTDTVARLGGDQFALLLPETNAAGARQILGKLRTLVQEELAISDLAITFSIGLITWHGDLVEPDDLLRRAGDLMHEAKRAGRNQVFEWWQVPLESPVAKVAAGLETETVSATPEAPPPAEGRRSIRPVRPGTLRAHRRALVEASSEMLRYGRLRCEAERAQARHEPEAVEKAPGVAS